MKYKIKKIDSAPPLSIDELSSYRKCYLGISINNPFFRDKHLGLLLKWISSHFDECVIIIGDYLHRINEYILHGNYGQEAIDSSVNRGDQIDLILQVALDILPKNKFKIYRWKEFLDLHPQAIPEKDRLTKLFKSHEKFNADIIQSSTEFIERLMQRGEPLYVSKDEAVVLSTEYLLEEMAVFSVLISSGYFVQVYPGTQLTVLKDLANNEFPGLDTNLRDGVYIDLTIKKIK